MKSNHLETARTAIIADLDYARQGLAYYQSRTANLESALTDLKRVAAMVDTAGRAVKRSPGQALATPGTSGAQVEVSGKKVRRSRKSGGQAEAATTASSDMAGQAPAEVEVKLPKTGTEFWLDLISAEPVSAAEVAAAAAQKLHLGSDDSRFRKLRNRTGPMLMTMLKANLIQDEGQGRERRYRRIAT